MSTFAYDFISSGNRILGLRSHRLDACHKPGSFLWLGTHLHDTLHQPGLTCMIWGHCNRSSFIQRTNVFISSWFNLVLSCRSCSGFFSFRLYSCNFYKSSWHDLVDVLTQPIDDSLCGKSRSKDCCGDLEGPHYDDSSD